MSNHIRVPLQVCEHTTGGELDPFWIVASEPPLIARLNINDDKSNLEEQRAYAQLFVTAPDLLRICKLVLARLDLEAQEAGKTVFPCAAYRDELRQAITKAEKQIILTFSRR